MTQTIPDRGIAGRGIDQAAVALLGIMFAVTGLQAAFFPKSFFDDFPIGRGWIALTSGAYNEHLVRDVGALFLALVIISIWAWWRPALCLPVAVGWLVVGVLHLVFHVTHLDDFDSADALGMVSSLALVPVLAIVAIVVDRNRHSQSRRSHP